MTFERSSGVLLHPTSLPGGRLGREAYRFVDWLAAAGQTWWQILPLGPPDEHRSPYKAESAFGDGTVKFVSSSISKQVLQALIHRQDGKLAQQP